MTSREQLFHLLAEAAELEHNILCGYLYAAFSLKQRADEGLEGREVAAVASWREHLMGLCVEEMVHLAQVSNLLLAVGSRPHFNRPNLPVAPGYHPAGIVIKLAPFDLDTLEHFIFLERPESAPAKDARPFAEEDAGVPRPTPQFAPLMPRAPRYDTIGQFYAAARAELERASQEMGESRLFCGSATRQLRPDEINAPELVVVTDLASARCAVDFIVEQGEGSGADREQSHYGRFQAIKAEYKELTAARAAFTPHRAVVANPVMHPGVDEDRVHIVGARSAPVIDAANACYCLMLRCLAQLYELPSSRAGSRGALLGAAMAAMKAVTGLGVALTELPVGADDDQRRAGMSFAMLRAIEGPLEDRAIAALAERLAEIANRLPELGLAAGVVKPLAATLAAAAAGLGQSG